MAATHPFRPALFRFLKDLAENNDREWFTANKGRYEDEVRGPAIEFIAACAPGLERISKEIRADPRPVGGSLFRIHRDVRFSKDKRPYKTHTGVHFRHARGKDAHAPGYYLHLEPGNSFMGFGIWQPDTATARAIRAAILDDPKAWKRAAHAKGFQSRFDLSGESLKRPPAGVDAEHPLVDDLKRKDFVGVTTITQKQVTARDFDREFVDLCEQGAPLMRFLCRALELPF